MAGYYKKRKSPQGPNKNEKKVLRGQREEEFGGSIASRLPSLRRLRLQLTFLDARQNPLEEKTVSLGASDRPAFKYLCPGRCGHGSFDFSTLIVESVNAAAPQIERSVKCAEPLFAGTQDTCGCELRFRIEFEYAAAPKAPTVPASGL